MGQVAATVETLRTELDKLKTSVSELRTQFDVLQLATVNKQWPSHHSSSAIMDDFPPDTAITGDAHFSTVTPIKHSQPVRQVDNAVPKRVSKQRLHPHTTDNELLDCVKETAAMCNTKTVEVTCPKLRSKYADLYSSFYVSVRVETQQFKDAIDEFMSAESWPIGVLVKRFFKPKNGGT